MTKEGKIILSLIVGTIILIAGLAFLMTKASNGSIKGDRFVSNTLLEGLEVRPLESIDLGKVPYGEGIVSKTFDIKNTLDKEISLKKITTSCMCTKAKFVINGRESKFYGMEMNGDLNPLIDYKLPAGAEAKVVFEFDPAAHGPQGIGPFARIITLYFDAGYKELKFNGEVVK